MLTVDRIEEKIAICQKDDRTMVELEVHKLPSGVKEGDILNMNEDGSYDIDVRATGEKKQELNDRFSKMFK